MSSLTLDDKGRLSMPTKYRERLRESGDGQLIITIDRGPCLLIYPLLTWKEVIEPQLSRLPSANKQARKLKRLLMGHAEDCPMDANGRLLLPNPLRVYAKLIKHVALVGQGNKFELWDEQIWNHSRDEWLIETEEDEGLSTVLESLSF